MTDESPTSERDDSRIYAQCVSAVYRQRARATLSVFFVSVIPIITGWGEDTRTVTLILVAGMWAYSFLAIYLGLRFTRADPATLDMQAWGRGL